MQHEIISCEKKNHEFKTQLHQCLQQVTQELKVQSGKFDIHEKFVI